MNSLSPELLIPIFAQLPENELIYSLSKVCKKWRFIIQSNGLWQEAFRARWSGSIPILPFCTMPSSVIIFWRKEYAIRLQVEEIWKMARLDSISFDSSVGANIDSYEFLSQKLNLSMDVAKNEERMRLIGQGQIEKSVAGSKETAVIVKCNPKTGKINRNRLIVCKSEEQGFENAERLSALKFSPRSVGTWVLAARYDGSIMACFESESIKHPNETSIWSAKIWFPSKHIGRVTDVLAIPQATFLSESLGQFFILSSELQEPPLLHYIPKQSHCLFFSCGVDGNVLLWCTLVPDRCICSFMGNTEPLTKCLFAFDTLLAQTISGRIVIWSVGVSDTLDVIKEPAGEIFFETGYQDPLPRARFMNVDESLRVLLVQSSNTTLNVYNFDSLLDNLEPRFTITFESEPCFIKYEPSTPGGIAGLLAVGFENGTVGVWKILSIAASHVCILNDSATSVTCIYTSPLFLITGCKDGSIFIYDTIQFNRLRGLNNKKHQNRDGSQDRFHIISISVSGFTLCATQSQIAYTWYPKLKVERTKSRPKSVKLPISFSRGSISSSPSHTRQDVLDEVFDVMKDNERERRRLSREKERVLMVNGDSDHHGMSEQELLEFALVLSVHDSV